VGHKGSGKSYLAKKIAKEYKGRVLLFDLNGEYGSSGPEGIPGLKCFDSLQTYFAWIRLGNKARKCAIGATWQTFEAFCKYAFSLGNCMVIIEEVSNYTTEARSSRAFRSLYDRSRHADIELVVITSRPAYLPPPFRGQVDEWLAFQTSEPRDLDFWRECKGKKAAEEIRKLKQFETATFT